MYNKVILIGNLGKDPEVRHLDGGVSVAKFSLATNESYKDKSGEWVQKTEWHDIVLWRGLAEKAERELKKGSSAFVEGKLTHRKWQDKEGVERYTTEVVANVLRSLDKRESNSGQGGNFPPQSGAPSYSNPSDPVSAEPGQKDEVDDLPF